MSIGSRKGWLNRRCLKILLNIGLAVYVFCGMVSISPSILLDDHSIGACPKLFYALTFHNANLNIRFFPRRTKLNLFASWPSDGAKQCWGT